MEPDAPITIPRHRRSSVVARAMLVALGVFAAVLFFGAAPPPLVLAAAPVALVSFLATLAWGWAARVEFGRSSMTLRGPWGSREVRYDAVARAELRWEAPHAARAPDSPVTALVHPEGGAPFAMSATWGSLAPVWARVCEASRARHRDALARGEVVTFRDASALPWVGVLATAAAALMLAVSLSAQKGVLVFGAMLAAAASTSWRELRDWRSARRAGGLELSAEGIREVGARRDDAREAYRQMRGSGQGWIPWSEVQWVLRDDRALRIGTRHRPEALYVSPSAEVDALHDLLAEHIERHRAPIGVRAVEPSEALPASARPESASGPTCVRVAVDAEAPEGATHEVDAHEVSGTATRAARGRG